MTHIPFNPESSEAESSKLMVVQDDLPKIRPDSTSGTIRKVFSAFGKTGLSSQLLLTVLPLALVPIAVASAIGYFVTQSKSEYELTEQLKGQSVLAGETISRNVEDQAEIAAIIARSPFLMARVRNNLEVAASENLSGLSIGELEKRFSRNKLIAPNQELNDFLREAAEAKQVAEIIVADRNGLNVGFSTQPIDSVQSDEDWWEQGEAQAQWIGNPVFDASAGQYGIDITRRVVDPQSGRFIGVIRLFSSAAVFGDLTNLLTGTGLRGSQQLQVIDLDTQLNVVNFRSEKDQVVRAAQELPPKVVTDLGLRLLTALPEVKDRSLNEIEQEIQESLEIEDLLISSSQAKTVSGEPLALIATFYYKGKQYALSTVPRLNWIAVASMNQAEIEVTGRELLNLFAIIALALGAVGTVLMIALSRRLASPLNALSEKARQVSDGDLDVAAELKGSAEARTLALTFNNLVFRVKDALQEQTLNTQRAKLAANVTGTRLLSSQELPFLLSDTLTEARDILGSDRVVVYQFKPDWGGTIVAESVADSLPSAFQEQLEDPCIPAATRDKYLMDGILLEHDIAAANLHPEHLALLQSLRVRSILGVPIISQGRLFGLLIAHHCRTLHQWQPTEVEFMKQLGLQLGLVIERVQLFEQTQALVEEQRQVKEGLQRNALQLLMDIDPVMQGNLTARARVTEDEIGTVADSYNATIASLRKIVGQVQQAAQQVAETTNTSESAVKNLSDSAVQQAAEILSVLERVEEMANSVRLVAISAEKAEVAVQEAAQTVQEGDEAMNRTVDGILAIRETVAETAKKVKRLGESSQKISNVVNLISSFAAQTNMLALNASIEASRAGEDGKGFAVVAEEVRNLARQSAEATTEIEKLVANIQSETNELVRTMEAGTEQVVAGTRLVDDTRQSLNKITATSLQISELVEAIAQATVTQSQASETVTQTMTTVAQIADKNTITASEVNASFEQLRSVAQALQAEVGRFKLN